MATKKKIKKPAIYAEVKPITIEKLDEICKLYGLNKSQAVGMAIAYLAQEKPKIKIVG